MATSQVSRHRSDADQGHTSIRGSRGQVMLLASKNRKSLEAPYRNYRFFLGERCFPLSLAITRVKVCICGIGLTGGDGALPAPLIEIGWGCPDALGVGGAGC